MLRKIKLYGELAKFIGQRVLYADVKTAAQATKFLIVNWPGVEKHMADRYYKITADEWEIDEDELTYPLGNSEIKIIPVVGGAGRDTWKIIIGITLIGVAFATGGASLSLGLGGFTGGLGASSIIGNLGLYLTLSGIASALSPNKEIPDSEQDPRRSFNFSGIQNTSRAGSCVPCVYGEVITGSVVITAGIDTSVVTAP